MQTSRGLTRGLDKIFLCAIIDVVGIKGRKMDKVLVAFLIGVNILAFITVPTAWGISNFWNPFAVGFLLAGWISQR